MFWIVILFNLELKDFYVDESDSEIKYKKKPENPLRISKTLDIGKSNDTFDF
jgi:hypothetical protein